MNQPLRIEELACEIARLEAKAADCHDLMAIIEVRELLVIIQRTDSAGKVMYTNAESRAAAALTELVADKVWPRPVPSFAASRSASRCVRPRSRS